MHIYENLIFVIIVSLLLMLISFFIISRLVSVFKCPIWMLFIPTFILIVGIILCVLFILWFNHKDSVLQFLFFGILNYLSWMVIDYIFIVIVIIMIRKGQK